MAAKDLVENVAVGVLAICAIAVTASLVKREFFDRAPSINAAAPKYIQNWMPYASGTERIGAPNAKHIVVVFSDFECPFCRQFSLTSKALLAKHLGELEIVHRNYPLTMIHPYARPAAVAGECAANQAKFSAFSEYVFSHQTSLGMLNWKAVARKIGIRNEIAFAHCLVDGSTDQLLKGDSLAAESLKISGTPLVIVDGWMFPYAPTEASVDSVLAGDKTP